jgi:hypothetical protein
MCASLAFGKAMKLLSDERKENEEQWIGWRIYCLNEYYFGFVLFTSANERNRETLHELFLQ